MSAKYYPGYFESFIPTDLPLDNLALLPQWEQALCYHEYIHYLQNITTTFGLSRTWNLFDRMRQVIGSVQAIQGNINLPLSNPAVTTQRRNFSLINNLNGSSSLPVSAGPESGFVVSSIQLVNDPLLDLVVPGHNAAMVQLTLSQSGFASQTYTFGEKAISESMAHLLEHKFYGNQPHTHYPYLVAGKVAAYYDHRIAANPELLLALCDIALMHPFPGWAFCDLLLEGGRQNYFPKDGRDLINFGMRCYANKGWKVLNELGQATNALIAITDILYNDPFYTTTKDWFQFIVRSGAALRLSRPDFIIDLYHDNRGFGYNMAPIFVTLGGPHFRNNFLNRYMSAPYFMRSKIGQIHPQHLRISGQINEFLLMGVTQASCQIQTVCDNSVTSHLVDARCATPWIRSNDQLACPFVAAWNLYGFNNKVFLINGIPI